MRIPNHLATFTELLVPLIFATAGGRAHAAAFDIADARHRLETCVAGPGGLRTTDPREAALEESHRLMLLKLRVITALGGRANLSDLHVMGMVFGGMVHVWSNHLPRREALAMYHDDPARAAVDCLHGIVREALDVAPIDADQRRSFLGGLSSALRLAQGASAPARLAMKFGLGGRLPAVRQAFAAEDPALARAVNEDLRRRLRDECDRLLLK